MLGVRGLWWIGRGHTPDSRERRWRMYFGGGGLLIVLGIIALVLGYYLIGIILIILGLLAGGFGFYGSRPAPDPGDPFSNPSAAPGSWRVSSFMGGSPSCCWFSCHFRHSLRRCVRAPSVA